MHVHTPSRHCALAPHGDGLHGSVGVGIGSFTKINFLIKLNGYYILRVFAKNYLAV